MQLTFNAKISLKKSLKIQTNPHKTANIYQLPRYVLCVQNNIER